MLVFFCNSALILYFVLKLYCILMLRNSKDDANYQLHLLIVCFTDYTERGLFHVNESISSNPSVLNSQLEYRFKWPNAFLLSLISFLKDVF